MRIVIDIPDHLYNSLVSIQELLDEAVNMGGTNAYTNLLHAISIGTPLPKEATIEQGEMEWNFKI